ncbi:galactokinase [Solitalea sp. MAHUQ-68]|uniref:Galactokinase n=1 Tax=Solitalea agri TaxID=2953739 RepID=A0A9X2JC90_9SPHI|nr:galactokinase [Solitalea agri]MCO4293287.1 galactokinase [Solitalea agri]
MKNNLTLEFEKVYGNTPEYHFFCPGRVNLIGEHIDYNGGKVLPCAISLGTHLLVSKNNEGLFRFRSLNFEEKADIILANTYTKTGKDWFNYPLGVINYLSEKHKLQGLDFLFYGNLPTGSGLSSSASIEVLTAYAIDQIFSLGIDKLDIVKVAKRAENEFIGVNCGIMDQFAVAFGEKDKALELDCDTVEYTAVPFKLGDYVLAIVNTNKPRKLADSKYNERFTECRTALAELQKELKIQHLCDINSVELEAHLDLIKNFTIAKRAKHVVSENERVQQSIKALAADDLSTFGQLMFASHDSLKNLYEVTGVELDTVVDYCKKNPNVLGARMTGAGFGGCAIAIVKASKYDEFAEGLDKYYFEKIGYRANIFKSGAESGVRNI